MKKIVVKTSDNSPVFIGEEVVIDKHFTELHDCTTKEKFHTLEAEINNEFASLVKRISNGKAFVNTKVLEIVIIPDADVSNWFQKTLKKLDVEDTYSICYEINMKKFETIIECIVAIYFCHAQGEKAVAYLRDTDVNIAFKNIKKIK